ncbi:chorion protein S18 [Drosophila grimshawi]|uniref:Chorion protein S18 n=1 Tax=Drosophila grimshawi TaxID=7222 RepID=CH18_DROGR|nr:chorion protein S18 [Drosophila grimshawi]P24513.1 RecName: Full=Chorion protein S18; Flags: Precursor [Drosophila grimshawi]EDV96234.1 chorion protein 18 [Drosophila grimshawi]CAA37504.1 chorion protein s18 [Drosophila grimshawi]
MMKFMCLFVCAIAAVSASDYGNVGYGRVPVGGLAYQVQPALTVSSIVPVGGYGGGYGGGRGYGRGYGRSVEVPVAAVWTPNSRYGVAPVDRQALGLAKLSLAAPGAGGPLVLNEPRRIIKVSGYGPQRGYKQPLGYGSIEQAQGASAAAASSSVAGQNKGYQNGGY